MNVATWCPVCAVDWWSDACPDRGDPEIVCDRCWPVCHGPVPCRPVEPMLRSVPMPDTPPADDGRPVDVDELVAGNLGRVRGAEESALRDPVFHHRLSLLRLFLRSADAAMSAEGVPADVRERVARRVLLGHPDPVDTVARVDDRRVMAERTTGAADLSSRLEEITGNWAWPPAEAIERSKTRPGHATQQQRGEPT